MSAQQLARAAEGKGREHGQGYIRLESQACWSEASRSASKPEQLVCRYCGSDDLAPSFIKRRDARCRGCFKKRYGSSARPKTRKAAGTQKSKAAK